MNFSELKLQSLLLAELEGYSDTSPLPDWSDLVNQALSEFSRLAEYYTESGTLTSVANQVKYTLPALLTHDNDWVRVTDMLWNSAGTAGSSGSRITLTDENILRRTDPLWNVVGAGTPYLFYNIVPNAIGLYPPPSGAGTTIFFKGIREAPLLLLETDEPTFPKFYHDAICLIAQWRHLRKYNPTPNAFRNYQEGIEKAHGLRRELYAGSAPAFQIRQSAEAPQRLGLGGFSRRGW